MKIYHSTAWPPNGYRLLISAAVILLSGFVYGQEMAPVEPGKLSVSDFSLETPLTKSASNAVVLTDIGKATLESYNQGWRVFFKHLRRIKILSASGLTAGTIIISFSEEDNNDKLKDLKAYTYNEKNGAVEITPVSSKDFNWVHSKTSDRQEVRFAFPNMRVGSIIEYSYTLKSTDIQDLYPWNFQGDYPRLWSEYTVVVPDIFNYTVTVGGKLPFYKTSTDSVIKEIWIGNGNEDHPIYTKKWVMKDVPVVKNEPYVNCMDSYLAKIRFQLSAYPTGRGFSRSFLRSWEGLTYQLMGNVRFGYSLSEENGWLRKCMDTVLSGCTTKLEQAQKLFAFLRDRFSCTGKGVMLNRPLPEVLESRSGNTAEINLLLAAMLRKLSIQADPVVLSTKDNGLTKVQYPVVENLNYVIDQVLIDNKAYYLDASQKNIGFGRLPLCCYNGHARVIKRGSFPVFLTPDTLKETRSIVATIVNNEKGGQTAQIVNAAGYYESVELRNTLQTEKEDDYFANLSLTFPYSVELKSHSIDSLKQYERPVQIRYAVSFPAGTDSVLYFNPLLNMAVTKNPFAAENRIYPIELPYTSSLDFVLNMEIPRGYRVEELPKPATLKLNNTDGLFEYFVEVRENQIQLRCKLDVNKADFDAVLYSDLRDFYESVVRKESESIVFRRMGSVAAN